MSSQVEQVEEWFEAYSKDIYNYLCYSLGHRQVEDLLQEVFLKALKGSYNHLEVKNPKAWLFTMARHVIIDQQRKRKLKFLSIDKVDALDNVSDLASGISHATRNEPLEKLIQDEERRLIYRHVLELKQSYREIFILRVIQGVSVEESAEILAWSKDKVKLTLHRALKSLRKSLQKEGGFQHESI